MPFYLLWTPKNSKTLIIFFSVFFFFFHKSFQVCKTVPDPKYVIFQDDFGVINETKWTDIRYDNTSNYLSASCGANTGSFAFVFKSSSYRTLTSQWIIPEQVESTSEYDIDSKTVHLSFWFVIGRDGYPGCEGADEGEDVHLYVRRNFTNPETKTTLKVFEFNYNFREPSIVEVSFDVSGVQAFQLVWQQQEWVQNVDNWAIDDVLVYYENRCSFPLGNCYNDSCNCTTGLTGDACELIACPPEDVNYCSNGGECYMDQGFKKCYCKGDYTGEFCTDLKCEERDIVVFFDDFEKRRKYLWNDMTDDTELNDDCGTASGDQSAVLGYPSKIITTKLLTVLNPTDVDYVLSFWFVIGAKEAYSYSYRYCYKGSSIYGGVRVELVTENEQIINILDIPADYKNHYYSTVIEEFNFNQAFRIRFIQEDHSYASLSTWAIDDVTITQKNKGCLNRGGICVRQGESTGCECKNGYYGPYCTYSPCHVEEITPDDPVIADYCNNQGTCLESTTLDKVCKCDEYFLGSYCQYRKIDGDSNAKGFVLFFDEFIEKNDKWVEMDETNVILSSSCGSNSAFSVVFRLDVRTLTMKEFFNINSNYSIAYKLSFWFVIGAGGPLCEAAEAGDGVYVYLVTRGKEYVDKNVVEEEKLLMYLPHDYNDNIGTMVHIEFFTSKNFKIRFEQKNFLYGSDAWAVDSFSISSRDVEYHVVVPPVPFEISVQFWIIFSIVGGSIIVIVLVLTVIVILLTIYLCYKKEESQPGYIDDQWTKIANIYQKTKHFVTNIGKKKKWPSNLELEDSSMKKSQLELDLPNLKEDEEKTDFSKEKKSMKVEISKEKIDFLFEEDFFDLEIEFADGKVIKTFKSLFIQSELNLESIKDGKLSFKEDQMKSVDSEIVNNIMFGKKESIKSNDEIFDLFVLFKRMKCKGLMYVVGKKIGENLNIKDLLQLFRQCLVKFEFFQKKELSLDQILEDETPIDEEVKFHSSLTLAVFNTLRILYKDILSNDKYVAYLCALNYWKRLTDFTVRPLDRHADFIGCRLKESDNFESIFKDSIIMLFKTKKYTNLTLKTKDKKEISVHREIILSKSNFFHTMVKFDGRESESMDEKSIINIDILSYVELYVLIDYLYIGVINSNDIKVLFKLLEHSEMFLDKHLQNTLIEKIKGFFGNREDDFLPKLISHSWRIKNIPNHLQNKFTGFFKTTLRRIAINNLYINNIIKISTDNKKKDEEIERLKKELDDEYETATETDTDEEVTVKKI